MLRSELRKRRKSRPAKSKPQRAKPLVVVTGAAGRLGRRLVPLLVQRYRVRAADRSPEALRALAGVERVSLDLERAPDSDLRALCRGALAVIHLAGRIDYLSPRDVLVRANAATTQKLGRAARAEGVKRFVLASSTSVYGNPAAAPADERAPLRPVSAYGESKVLAEQAARASGIPCVVLRPTIIYGPEFAEGFASILTQLRRGKFTLVGDGSNRVPFVHVQDVARAFAAAVTRGKPGQAYNVAGGEAWTQKRLVLEAAKALGVAVRFSSIPKPLAHALARAKTLSEQLTGREPRPYAEWVRVLGEDRAFSNAKAKRGLGWTPRVPLKRGIREVVRALAKKEAEK